MAYTHEDFKSGKAFKEKFKSGERITAYQPGPFGPNLADGEHTFEGPHSPKPHRWYVRATIKDGVVVAIKGVKIEPKRPPTLDEEVE